MIQAFLERLGSAGLRSLRNPGQFGLFFATTVCGCRGVRDSEFVTAVAEMEVAEDEKGDWGEESPVSTFFVPLGIAQK